MGYISHACGGAALFMRTSFWFVPESHMPQRQEYEVEPVFLMKHSYIMFTREDHTL